MGIGLEASGSTGGLGLAGHRVLVVEDENLIALDLQRRLESLGYVVTGMAGTGEAASGRRAPSGRTSSSWTSFCAARLTA